LAHVDIPKGDLDASNSIGDFNDHVIAGSTVYPHGTTEGFPHVIDTQGNLVFNSAHDYAECSNKGLCDRKTGVCECLPGYDGVACQRASCPSANNMNSDAIKNFNKAVKDFSSAVGAVTDVGTLISSSRSGSSLSHVAYSSNAGSLGQCSGVGTCETIADLAFSDYGNAYNLWDKKSTMGCKCDPGYSGPDCSEKVCTYGIDPMFTDEATIRTTQTAVRFETSDNIDTLSGTYAIKFYDVQGEAFMTRPLSLSDSQKCPNVISALKALPNEVVKDVSCSETSGSSYFEYILTFIKNPGKLKQLELNKFLDGSRSTVSVSSGTYYSSVYNLVLGEFQDYFPEKCEGITVKVLADFVGAWAGTARPGSIGYLSGVTGPLTPAEKRVLKTCLGDSDGNTENNVDVSNWDLGAVTEAHTVGSDLVTVNMIGAFPHAIKVVPVESSVGYDKLTPGSYHLVWYDETATDKEFRVSNIGGVATIPSEATASYVFTTRGIVQQMGWGAPGSDNRIVDNSSGGASSTRIVGNFERGDNKIYTNYDTSCEKHYESSEARPFVCVQKGDKLFVVDGCWGEGDFTADSNPIFGGVSLASRCADVAAPSKYSGNIYTVTRVYAVPLAADSDVSPNTISDISSDPSLKRFVNTNIIEVDANLPWSGSLMGDPENSSTTKDDTAWSDNTGTVVLFHFTPDEDKSYTHTSQCSNRGLCDTVTGLCTCFRGYTGEDCSVQSVLAVGSTK